MSCGVSLTPAPRLSYTVFMKKFQDVKCFLLDMDGTVHVSGSPILGAAEAVSRMRQQGRVLFLTNNTSLSRAHYVQKLNGMGFCVTENDIYTAGNATADYLKQHPEFKKIHLFGTESLKEEFLGAGLNLTETDPDLVVVGFHTSADYESVSKICGFIRAGIPFIATHPDLNCPVKGGYIPDVGSLLALIEASTGKKPFLICGKPFEPVAAGIKNRTGVKASETAMFGDRLSTDMVFALNNGFIAALVLSGEATAEDLKNSGLKADAVLNSIADWDRN